MINEIFIICIFILITGACIGSFLNVAALRAISKESIVFPPSKCPICNKPIKWFDNIPVLSYFLTFKGKCRNCGEKVSFQYPIVEALTAVMFTVVFLAFGFTIKTLLILILICLSIVISITDFKRNEVYDVHSWALIIMSVIAGLYLNGLNNYTDVIIGLITGVIVMEAIARLSYFLIKKEKPADESENNITEDDKTKSDDEDIDIKEYVIKNKRAFGEGDTYLAAAAGALLGWKYVIAAIAIAIILQALCILPQFLINLHKQKEDKLLISISAFAILAAAYWFLSNTFQLHLYIVFAFIIALIVFAIDSITRLKNTYKNEQKFSAIPFGPALLLSMFLLLFFNESIISFINHYIFLIL